jgi:hypothetical protein
MRKKEGVKKVLSRGSPSKRENFSKHIKGKMFLQPPLIFCPINEPSSSNSSMPLEQVVRF